jgi:hypothetical protein
MICVVWVYFFLPEVKGRTLEEIDAMVRYIQAARLACRLTNRLCTIVQRETSSKEVPNLPSTTECQGRKRGKVKH